MSPRENKVWNIPGGKQQSWSCSTLAYGEKAGFFVKTGKIEICRKIGRPNLLFLFSITGISLRELSKAVENRTFCRHYSFLGLSWVEANSMAWKRYTHVNIPNLGFRGYQTGNIFCSLFPPPLHLQDSLRILIKKLKTKNWNSTMPLPICENIWCF